MATLTYDPTEYQEGEFTAEELEAIQVGEELAAHEENLLAGKYRDAQELEAAYIELQRKLGSRDSEDGTDAEVDTDEAIEEDASPQFDSSLVDELYRQYNQGEFTDEAVNAIQSMSPAEVADMFLERGQADVAPALSDQDIGEFKSLVGGDDAYDTMVSWASENLNEQEIGLFDSVMEGGNPQAIYFAIQALSYRFRDAQGYDGELLTGSAPTSGNTGFRSQAEVVRAMSDPRYDNDPAYRQDIFDKLERSNLEF
jgi:hypothetical protein